MTKRLAAPVFLCGRRLFLRAFPSGNGSSNTAITISSISEAEAVAGHKLVAAMESLVASGDTNRDCYRVCHFPESSRLSVPI